MPLDSACHPQQPATLNDHVDAVLAASDGDAREAVAALLRDIEYLQDQIAYASLAVSRGFCRGWKPSYQRDR